MGTYLQVFRATVAPEDVARLLVIRPAAIAQARAACPELLRAELVRLDERTWLDVLTWSVPDGERRLMDAAGPLDALHEMHGLIGEVLSVEHGRVEHSTEPAGQPAPAVEEVS
jgi:hypothetical protein